MIESKTGNVVCSDCGKIIFDGELDDRTLDDETLGDIIVHRIYDHKQVCIGTI